MKGKLFSIGELSKIKGITVKALRFYERIGLVKPHHIDSASGYRYYSIEQFLQFDIIKAARAMDMSLKDVKAILDIEDNATLLECLRLQEGRASKKIKELQRILSMIDAARIAIGASVASASERDIYFKELPERRIVAKSIASDSGPTEVIIGYASLDGIISEYRLINAYETGVLFEGDASSGFRPSKVFNAVALADESDASPVSIIPAGRFLCVSYSAEDAESQQSKLSSHLRRIKRSSALLLQVDLLNAPFLPDSGRAELQALIGAAAE